MLTPSTFHAAAAASRPGLGSGFLPKLLEVGVRLASLSERERREGLQNVDTLVRDVAEWGRQPVKLSGLNPAGAGLGSSAVFEPWFESRDVKGQGVHIGAAT